MWLLVWREYPLHPNLPNMVHLVVEHAYVTRWVFASGMFSLIVTASSMNV